ncbi:MAG: metal ABC transporter substrate-binding protein, partial [Bacilli bacterium]
MKKWLLSFALIGALLAGCTNNSASEQNPNTIQITTTTGMIADIVKNVGGERVEVTALMRPGVDPHLYKASQGDILKLAEAEMVFYNGLHLEGKMTEIFK